MALKINSVDFTYNNIRYKAMRMPSGTLVVLTCMPGVPSQRLQVTHKAYDIGSRMIETLRDFFPPVSA